MATFVARGFSSTSNPTPHSPYALTRNMGIAVPDGVYRVGDRVALSTSSSITLDTTFVGYVTGTNYPIFERVGTGTALFEILFTTDPGGNSYDPGEEADIIRESFGIGGPIVFADLGHRPSSGTVYTSQGVEVEFDRAVYDVDDAATLRLITSRDADGSPNYGQTITTTFTGLDPRTGNPLFTPTGSSSNYNNGGVIVAASVRDPEGYNIPTHTIVAEAWPPEVTFSNYGVRQGADIDNDVDFDLQGTSPGFVGLDIPAGVHRAGETLTIRAFGGMGDGESVEVEYVGFHDDEAFRYPVFEAADFNGQRTQFIGTRELNTETTYDPLGNLNTITPFATGVATFADQGLRRDTGNTDVLDSRDRVIEFDYRVLVRGSTVNLRIYRETGGGGRELEETVRAEYAGFDRETGDPLFNPDGGGRQILAASVKATGSPATYTVPPGDILSPITHHWPPAADIDATYTNYGFRQGDLDAAFALQGTGVSFGLHVPPGIYSKGDTLTIQAYGGTARGSVDVEFVGYVADVGGTHYPIFEHANFLNNGRAQFIGTNEAHETANYAVGTSNIVDDMPLGIGNVTFTNFAQREDAASGIGDGEFFYVERGVTFAHGFYQEGDTVMIDFGEDFGQRAMTFVGYESDTGYPIFRDAVFGRLIVAINENLPSNSIYTVDNLVTDMPYTTAGPAGTGDATFTNYGQRLGSEIGDGAFVIQAFEVTIPQGTYDAGDPVTLDIQLFGPTAAIFLGYESDTGYPVFRNATGPRFYVLTNENLPNNAAYTVDNLVTDMSYTTCFAPGTLIATPDGESAVETLKPGDAVLTADGGTVPVRFVGFQKVPTMFGSREVTHPVRIRAGALGRNTPHTDLVVTKDHGMIVDGVICHAGALINGTSIVEVPTAELGRVATYYHVETEGHVPLLANGAVAESFIDEVDRARFANHGEFVAMYGSRAPAMTQMNLPRAMSMRQVPQGIRLRLAERAAVLLAPAAPSGVRRLWQELRDRVARSTGHRLARGLGIAWYGGRAWLRG